MNQDRIITTREMARILGVSPRRVRQLAARRHVGHQLERGVWVFRLDDVEQLRPGPVGRPRRNGRSRVA